MKIYSKKHFDNKSFKSRIDLWIGQWTYRLISLDLSLVNEKYLLLNPYLINNLYKSLKYLSKWTNTLISWCESILL